jgi:hypothetical protein
MNYNTNRTIQAVCAKALIYQTDHYQAPAATSLWHLR